MTIKSDTYRLWKLGVTKLLNAGSAFPWHFLSWATWERRPPFSESHVLFVRGD